jgi:regulator of extracellular matrix RemA (YlzA/DUF370 family)
MPFDPFQRILKDHRRKGKDNKDIKGKTNKKLTLDTEVIFSAVSPEPVVW